MSAKRAKKIFNKSENKANKMRVKAALKRVQEGFIVGNSSVQFHMYGLTPMMKVADILKRKGYTVAAKKDDVTDCYDMEVRW
jgi:hypothetical protein